MANKCLQAGTLRLWARKFKKRKRSSVLKESTAAVCFLQAILVLKVQTTNVGSVYSTEEVLYYKYRSVFCIEEFEKPFILPSSNST